MGIQKDAGELLGLVHKNYTEKNLGLNDKEFVETTGWKMDRLRRAVQYLGERNLVYLIQGIGGNFSIIKPYPDGIDIVENEGKFKNIFGFEIGLPGFFKFSWTKEEK